MTTVVMPERPDIPDDSERPADAKPQRPEPGRRRSKALYQTLWRWHFYAGVFCLPFLVVLAVTGGVYLFKPQIEGWIYADWTHVRAQPTEPVPFAEQLAAVGEAHPGASVLDVLPSSAADRSTAVDIATADGDEATVFVNPYNAEVLGTRDESTRLMTVMEDIHGSLTLGDFGDRVMELVACTAVVLVLTGVYLYWPRRRSKRVRKPKGRARWKAWHGRIGLAGSALILGLLLTGLPWTGVWGELYSSIAASVGSDRPSPDPHSDTGVRAGDLDAVGKPVPWAAEQVPVPRSGGGHGGHGGHGSGSAAPEEDVDAPGAAPASLETVLAVARQEGVDGPVKIVMPDGPGGVYTVGLNTDEETDPAKQHTVFLDQYTAKPLEQYTWDDYGLMAKATTVGIRAHEGRLFGWVNVVLALLAVLAVLDLAATALPMWLKRRPKGTLGAPPSPPERGLMRVVAVLMLGLGIVLPLFGLALVVVLLVEFLVLRRLPATRRFFGIPEGAAAG